jgi:hypothetical protein
MYYAMSFLTFKEERYFILRNIHREQDEDRGAYLLVARLPACPSHPAVDAKSKFIYKNCK